MGSKEALGTFLSILSYPYLKKQLIQVFLLNIHVIIRIKCCTINTTATILIDHAELRQSTLI